MSILSVLKVRLLTGFPSITKESRGRGQHPNLQFLGGGNNRRDLDLRPEGDNFLTKLSSSRRDSDADSSSQGGRTLLKSDLQLESLGTISLLNLFALGIHTERTYM